MAKIYETVTAKNVVGFIDLKQKARVPYLGEALFPRKKQLGLKLEFIKGKSGLPVVLKASEFDVKTPLRDRVGFTTLEEDMPYFKEGYLIKEVDRQQINTFLEAGLSDFADAIIEQVFDDAGNLVEGARASFERMRMQAITEGKVSIAAEGTYRDFDYQLDPSQFVEFTGEDAWDQATSTPVQDILTIIENARKKGVVLTRIILNSVTVGYIAQHESIRKDMNPLGASNIILSTEDVLNYLRQKTKLQIAVYDNYYQDEAGVAQKFFPDNKVTFLTAGELGKSVYGTTPHESDLMTGAGKNTNADVAIVDGAIAVTTHKKVDPVNIETIVAMIGLPSFEGADGVVIATVAE